MIEKSSIEIVEESKNITIKTYKIVFNDTLEVFYLKRFISESGVHQDEFYDSNQNKLRTNRETKFLNTKDYIAYEKSCDLIKEKNI